MTFLRVLVRMLPTLVVSFVMAVAVWVTAVTAQDPNEQSFYPRAVPVEIIGQDPGLVIVDQDDITPVTISIRAPASIWRRLRSEQNLVQAAADISGLGSGEHSVEVIPRVSDSVRPAEVISVAPQFITITLEPLATQNLPIQLLREGEPAIGFQAEEPILEPERVTVSGPESSVSRISEVRAVLNLGDAHENIRTSLELTPLDENEDIVDDVSLSPERVVVTQQITQQGGYRNVVIRVVTEGQIASGYRLTNISVSPPAVTVFSTNPILVNNLPGFVETEPVNLTGANDDLDINVALDLPAGIEAVGDGTVLIQVGIAAIESSVTVANQQVEIVGLPPDLIAIISPPTVNIILFGPLPILERLRDEDVRVVVDVTNQVPGVYQLAPFVEMGVEQVVVQTINPNMVEITIEIPPTPTPSPSPTPNR